MGRDAFDRGRLFSSGGVMKGFPDLPPIWLVGFLILNWVISTIIPGNPSAPVLVWVGGPLIVAGVIVIAWSAFWFWRKKTTIEPHHAPQSLIVEGPYRVSRNPIYLAMIIILLGAVIWGGQPVGLILVPLFFGILTRRFVLPEEAGLRAAFGEDAETYLSRTRRWL